MEAPLVNVGVILLAGFGAGLINTVVGSGSLITFPSLVLLGYNPLIANISNNIGLIGGGISGAWGYRREISGQAPLLRRLFPLSLIGSVVGGGLLLALPARMFSVVVPALIGLALILVFAQPVLQRRRIAVSDARNVGAGLGLAIGVFGAGVYGGYFGAAQGVLLIGVLGLFVHETLQRINAVKNVLQLAVNSVAALLFLIFAWESVDWLVVLLILVGSAAGGWYGARVGRRLSPTGLRVVIVLVGLVAIARLTVFA